MDVSVALSKLRPHLRKGSRGGSKKFPRACALLADLLSAKLGPENEEVFFDALLDAVASGSGAGAGAGAGESASSSGNSGSGADGERIVALRRVGGVVGEAVGRLVAAAASRSSVFSGRRREVVEGWAREADGC